MIKFTQLQILNCVISEQKSTIKSFKWTAVIAYGLNYEINWHLPIIISSGPVIQYLTEYNWFTYFLSYVIYMGEILFVECVMRAALVYCSPTDKRNIVVALMFGL